MPAVNHTSKLPLVGTTIFTVMTALANQHGATNLSQGFPDFDCDDKLKRLVSFYLEKGMNQYAPMSGLIELRERLAEKIERIYGRVYSADHEITITAGATQAIFTSISAFINPGDEVIIFTPAYDSYEPSIEVNGGKTIAIPLSFPDFRIDFESLKSTINSKTKMIIINSPHNPSGAILDKEQMQQLSSLLKDTNIILISDEVYEHIIFDNESHESVARYPDLVERSIVISSFGKTYHNTGWKIGYCYGPKELMSEFRKVHQFNVFCVNRPIQHAFADFLKDDNSYLQLPDFYQEKRDYFLELTDNSKLIPLPCKGTYFQLMDYSGYSELSDLELAKKLTIENGIASIPVSVFYKRAPEHKVLRFCFAKNNETLEKGAEIISQL